VLRLSTGDIVSLDRGVIMGRAPQAPPSLPPELQPHVVRIASPQRDLSRNHVQVVVEGWQVVLRDLDTTNGTTVTTPGGTPTRLRGSDPLVLEPGSVVSMADEVTFTYQVSGEVAGEAGR
jgi:pSer/pThr/pTyr-binding forkhead associated (FHA) protein